MIRIYQVFNHGIRKLVCINKLCASTDYNVCNKLGVVNFEYESTIY